MEVVAVALLVGVVVGTVAWLAAWRFPQLDPASPKVATRLVATELERHPAVRETVDEKAEPAAAAGVALTGALLTAGAGLVGIGTLLAMVQTNSGFARWDTAFGQWGADHATSGGAAILRDLSQFGGTAGALVLALVVAVATFLRTRRWAVFTFLAVVMIGISVLVNGVKLIVDRARPDIRQLTGFSSSSFPSGHAATAAAMFAAFALVLGLHRSHRTKAALAGAAAGIAAAVASTRVLLGVHWFTDVLAGICLGWAWFAVCALAFGGRLLRLGAPIEAAERAATVDDLAQR